MVSKDTNSNNKYPHWIFEVKVNVECSIYDTAYPFVDMSKLTCLKYINDIYKKRTSISILECHIFKNGDLDAIPTHDDGNGIANVKRIHFIFPFTLSIILFEL